LLPSSWFDCLIWLLWCSSWFDCLIWLLWYCLNRYHWLSSKLIEWDYFFILNLANFHLLSKIKLPYQHHKKKGPIFFEMIRFVATHHKICQPNYNCGCIFEQYYLFIQNFFLQILLISFKNMVQQIEMEHLSYSKVFLLFTTHQLICPSFKFHFDLKPIKNSLNCILMGIDVLVSNFSFRETINF